MIDRAAICRRHGLSEAIAYDLHGETPEELEADAAARAAIAGLFGNRKAPASEPEPVETPDLPDAGKRFDDYTEDEWRAVHAESRRRLAARQEEQRQAAQRPAFMSKHEAARDLIERMHQGGEPE